MSAFGEAVAGNNRTGGLALVVVVVVVVEERVDHLAAYEVFQEIAGILVIAPAPLRVYVPGHSVEKHCANLPADIALRVASLGMADNVRLLLQVEAVLH